MTMRRIVILPSVLLLIVFTSMFIISAYTMHSFFTKKMTTPVENTSESISINSVPHWFKTLFPIPNSTTNTQNTSLMNDASGTVANAHIEGAYYDFWYAISTLFWWLLALYALTVVLILAYIKNMIHMLHKSRSQQSIESHAFALNQAFALSDKKMNKSSTAIEEEINLTEKMHQQVYQDPVTCLGNRRYFDMQFNHLISEHLVLGALLLIELQGLKQYNDSKGYKAGDTLIQEIAETIKENFLDVKLNFLTRIGGSTFAILTPNTSEEEVSQLATGLIHAIEEYLNTKDTPKILVHIGITSLVGIKNAAQALTFADQALQKAQTLGPYAFSSYEHEDHTLSKITSRTAIEWKNYITKIVEDNLVTVVYQPIIHFPDKTIISYEALLRVKETKGNLTVARLIIPMADRYGLTYVLDQCVMKQVLEKVKESDSHIPYVINLSTSTLGHEPTLQWLFNTLSSGEYRNKLIVELGEHTALNNLSLVESTIRQLKEYGVDVGIEHIGNDFSGFDYLKNLPLLYIKIDGSYIRDLNNKETQFFINLLTKTAHSLDIKVIAECVEEQSQWDILHTYHLDAAQGRLLAPPK